MLSKGRLYIAKVFSIYSQGRGKSAAHAWQQSSISIGAVSYISAQLYEQSYSSTF
ncbi:hypothetical protein HETIRDRAFT_174949 [Heterobasidion irregulare TC 32-1]|uniref:Uncharacterized protein n=1 Tax=Heterobasidion irregulare (strain TC 32-1) TaxID=747525 RepID=W4JUZ8_HETIT|nr:uncharacterized protein HETIRDRAFT_174949 [Heterobasidion irregulare TC 32-1]ETW76910.1 hypothetical protein HETIRDRAFT_174949 [Heterobasidion irregulare TC 32-1]